MLKALALYDRVGEVFHTPMFMQNLGVAFRGLKDEIARGGEGNTLATHTGDFELYELGTYDQESGEFMPVGSAPRLICRLSELTANLAS